MPRTRPDDTGGPGPEPAPFSLRAASRFVDTVLASTAVSVLFALISPLASALPLDRATMVWVWAGTTLLGWTGLLFLYEWAFLAARGATPGKMMTGIAVVGPDAGRPGRGRAALRSAVLCLPQALFCIGPFFTLVTSLGALSPNGGTLHVRTARTSVVRVLDAPAPPDGPAGP